MQFTALSNLHSTLLGVVVRNSLCAARFLSGKPLQRDFSRPPTLGESISSDGAAGEIVPRRDAARRSTIPRCFVDGFPSVSSPGDSVVSSRSADRSTRIVAREKRGDTAARAVRPFQFAAR